MHAIGYFRALFGYIQWRVISSFVSYLTDEFLDAGKDLETALYGTVIKSPRWQTCVRLTDSAIGFAMGALFVKDRFAGNSRKVVSIRCASFGLNAFVRLNAVRSRAYLNPCRFCPKCA